MFNMPHDHVPAGIDTVMPLRPEDAIALPLAHSRFTSLQLAEHATEFPDLAYRRGRSQYVVGGFWRHRLEIGAILELVAEQGRESLHDALIRAYLARSCDLVVLDPREQEYNQSFYSRQKYEVVDTLIQMERRGCAVTGRRSIGSVRAMEERDIAAVLAVERESFPWFWWNSEAELRWYAMVSGVELYVCVAEAQPEQVIGYAGFTVHDRQAHLDRLAVHKQYQRQGYGAALLVFVMSRMAALGARRVALTTQENNLLSQRLYRRFGFRESGWRHDIMGLRLGPRK